MFLLQEIFFLGGGRANVREFNLFCCYLLVLLSYSLKGQDLSKNGDDLCLFYFVHLNKKFEHLPMAVI